jgi:hypothetical protein
MGKNLYLLFELYDMEMDEDVNTMNTIMLETITQLIRVVKCE